MTDGKKPETPITDQVLKRAREDHGDMWAGTILAHARKMEASLIAAQKQKELEDERRKNIDVMSDLILMEQRAEQALALRSEPVAVDDRERFTIRAKALEDAIAVCQSRMRDDIRVGRLQAATILQRTIDGISQLIETPLYAAPISGEPVMWAVTHNGEFTLNVFTHEGNAVSAKRTLDIRHPKDKREIVPLYAAPLQQETDKDGERDAALLNWIIDNRMGWFSKFTPFYGFGALPETLKGAMHRERDKAIAALPQKDSKI